MVPPTEQLIRDYLSRLSAAARGQLEPDDRQALVDRTRDFIERKTGRAGPPTSMEVGRLLAGLGDPAALVQQERQRLAAVRGALPEPPAIRNPITKALRREPGKPRIASWHWPVADGRTDLQFRLLDVGGADRAPGNNSNGTAAVESANDGGHVTNGEAGLRVPAQARDRDWFFRALGGGRSTSDGLPPAADREELPDLAAPGQIRPQWRLAGANSADLAEASAGDDAADGTGAAAPTTISRQWQLTTLRWAVLRRQLRRAASAAAAWYRRRPLEASAVVLLGLGGAIYPPVWLLGAVLALSSRVWDGRDKWLGLALPVLLTIVAAVLGVAAGGHVSVGHAIHEGWVYAVVGSRIVAVLSALYLAWRSVHGRRPPAVPPWNRPHRVG